MSWKSIDVTAKLGNDGTLRVSERQRIVFDGAWNGGERRFVVDPGQQLVVEGVSSVNKQGKPFPMKEAQGEGIAFREYRFDGQTLRWRARNPEDPPFDNATRTYVIDYALRNVVERNGDRYNLAHDFGLPGADWPIDSFSVTLELDSGWEAPADFVPRFERRNIPGGEGVPLTLQLKWVGEGQPQYVTVAAPPPPLPTGPPTYIKPQPPAAPPPPPASALSKLIALAGFAFVAMLMMLRFLRREESVGRFEPPPEVTPRWLEEHLLVHRAEVVGAAWDGETGQGEVAALIAIMTAEGKIQNVPGAPRLRLLVPRETLSEYERGFVDALFVNGSEIDPETLRQHYRYTGFEPSRTIAGPLAVAAETLVGNRSRASWAFGCVAAIGCFFLFPLMAGAFVLTLPFAVSYRNSLRGRGVATALPLPLILAAALHALVNVSIGWLIANLFAGLVLLWVALRMASWRQSAAELRNLRNFHAARAFLLEWIRRREPVVDPRWIPYMLAFGLLPDDRWSVAAVPPPVEPRPMHDHDGYDQPRHVAPSPAVSGGGGGGGGVASGGGVAGAPVPSFAAGGGRFGGAGATGSWATIQSFAAAVAPKPPRSSGTTGSTRSSSSGSGWSWSSSGSSSSSSSRGSSSSRSSSSSSRGSGGGSSSRSSGSRSGGGGGGGW